MRDAALHLCQFPADVEQFRRCRIAYLSEFIQYLVYALQNLRKRHHAFGKLVKGRGGVHGVFAPSVIRCRNGSVFVRAVQIRHDVVHRSQRPAQVEQFVLLHVSAFQSEACHRLSHVEEVVEREILLFLL